ncbi:MAG: HAMP domain-containing sensor histidine kinase [Sulfurospirillaceae bacterium]|nr:HAMP domain-containing sensor histidine kinase [Sulfurospirillaceae bacterium]
MAKKQLPTLEALVIDLNSKNNHFLMRGILVFSIACIVLACLSVASFAYCDTLTLRIAWFIGVVFLSLGVAYMSSLYLLFPLFKTNRLLDLLLKDTLHELNVPLSVIKANLQMLKMGETQEKKLKKIERIELASDDLYGLYKDVDYYIKREIQDEIREVFDVKDIVDKEVEKFSEIYKDTKIIQDILPKELFADKKGFSKVINNLLSNALKYNKNSADVTVALKDTTLYIEDKGAGMSESELFLVFDRYYRGENEKKEGYGIGLSIVKAYCDESKIPIKITSKKDFGTCVSLDISHILYKSDTMTNGQ